MINNLISTSVLIDYCLMIIISGFQFTITYGFERRSYVFVEFFLSTLLSTSLLFKLILKTMPQIMLILSAKPFTLAPYYYKIDNILDIYYDYLIDTAQY